MSTCPYIDLAAPESFKGGAPREMYRWLRQNAPVYWHEDPVQGGFWAVTRQKELDYVSKNPQLFSSWQKTCFYADPEDDVTLDLMRLLLINMDPPDHVKYRRIVRNAFTPKAVDSYEPRFRQLAREIVDRIIDRGECEFVADVAAELPLIAICELMGIPLEDRHEFFHWTNIMLGADDPEVTTTQEEGQLAMLNVFEYGRKLAALHRESPRDTIVGALLSGVVEGEHLTEDEFCNFFLLLIVAGNETTRTVTSQGMRLLMEHPEEYQKLVEDPSLVPHAIEEFLRYNTAVVQFRRTATADVELDGQTIKQGDKVVLFYQSASADESHFSDPDQFDVTRGLREDVRNQHRAFGIGEHFCLGSHLARLELRCIFDELVARIRNPRLNGEINWLRSNFINGIKTMPIKFESAS